MYSKIADNYKQWHTLNESNKDRLIEGLRISDLRKNSGLSDITIEFRKERDRLMGSENKVAKFIDLEVNEKLDYIKAVFLTETTPKYPKDYDYKETEPEDYRVKRNTSKTYVSEIMFTNFFEWLSTKPDKEIITLKDIKEVVDVSDVKLFCSCMSFNFQGFAYKLTSEFESAIYAQDIPDPVWGARHNDNGLVCKHLSGIINGFSFYRNQIASALNKKLKDRKLI